MILDDLDKHTKKNFRQDISVVFGWTRLKDGFQVLL